MALLDVYPTYWVRCKPHGVIFPAFDPIWSRGKHEKCGLVTLEPIQRPWPVVIINDPEYDPKDREMQRILSCSECRGHGKLYGIDTRDNSKVYLECERCGGWGYL